MPVVKQSKIPKISWMTSQRLFDFYDKEDDQLGQENVLSKDILVYKEYQEGRGQEIMCDKSKKKILLVGRASSILCNNESCKFQ